LKHDSITKDGQEMAALYALGALSQLEARAFEVHLLDGCPACELELKQFEEVAGLIGTTVQPVAPPAYLRDLLSVRLQRENSSAISMIRNASAVTSAPVDTSSAKPASAEVLPFREQKQEKSTSARRIETPAARPRFATAWLPWAVAAALLVAFLYSFSAWRSALNQTNESTSAILKENKELKDQLAKEAAISAETAQINSVLSSPQAQTIELAGQEPAPNSSAKIYWDVQGARWVVTANLPAPPAGKVYQLWFVTPDSKISAGLISTDQNGHGFTVVPFPSSIAQLDAAAITLEPEGGSEQPTMPIYLLGKPS
jgi:anti-sigma-K factor RskA